MSPAEHHSHGGGYVAGQTVLNETNLVALNMGSTRVGLFVFGKEARACDSVTRQADKTADRCLKRNPVDFSRISSACDTSNDSVGHAPQLLVMPTALR